MKTHRLIVRLAALLLAGLPTVLLPTRGQAQAGSVDLGFDPGTSANNRITSVVVQRDGKILLGGDFTAFNGVARNRVARLNADGSLDIGFNPGSGANNTVQSVKVQSDGKIVLLGDFSTFNGVERNNVVRLNANGSLDTGFDPGTGVNDDAANRDVADIAVQSDGKIVVVGYFRTFNGVDRNKIARLNADGSVDTGFDPVGVSDVVSSVAVQADGRIVLVGGFSGGIARFNSDGSVDATFNSGGTEENSVIYSVAVQSDGKIVLGGAFSRVNGAARSGIARLNADGSLDTGFNPSTGADNSVSSVAVQPDGKIVIGDTFFSNRMSRSGVARLNVDGSLDTGFILGQGASGNIVNVASVAVQGDGKIVVGGEFSAFNGVARNNIARLNGDPAPALPAFFNGAVDVGGGFSYLPTFGYFKLLPASPGYVFHNDLGFLYYIDANDGKGGIYLYDFATTPGAKSLEFLYTAPGFPFPYLYSFDLKTFLYYFPDNQRGAGFYTTGPRIFSRLDTGEILFQ